MRMIDCEIFLRWLEPFTHNLEDEETHAPTHFSRDSDSRRTTKVAERSSKHNMFLLISKNERLRRLLVNQNNKGSFQKAHWRSSTTSKEVWWLITKSWTRSVNHVRIKDTAVVVENLATQWIQSSPCESKTSQETEKSLRKFFEPSEKPQVIHTDTSFEFAKSCRVAWNVAQNSYMLNNFGQGYVLFSCWSKGNAGNLFTFARGVRIRGWFRSFHTHADQKGFELRWKGHLEEVQTPNSGHDGQWRSGNIRGGTNLCSRSWIIRDCAITRWNASSFIARKTLRRPRILLWVGQRQEATVDPKWEDNHLQNRQPRTPCCSRIVNQFRWQCIFKVAVKRSVFNRFVRRATWCRSCRWGSAFQPKPNKNQERSDVDDQLQDLPEWLEPFTDNLEDTETHAPAHFLKTQIRNVSRKWQKD